MVAGVDVSTISVQAEVPKTHRSATTSAAENGTGPDAHRVVVATNRPTIHAFFSAVGGQPESGVFVTSIPLNSRAVTAAADVIGSADIAAVDASLDPIEALDVCTQGLRIKPDLNIVAIFCCQHSATGAQLQALGEVGVRSFVEEGQLSEVEALRILHCVARGRGVLRLQITGAAQRLFSGSSCEAVASELSGDEMQLLEQITRGLTDDEIGREMFLSRHTVKHRIERLRRRAGARNRVQLSAWASREFVLSDSCTTHQVPGHPLRFGSDE